MNGLALTDHGNLHGALEFYKKAKAAGINPILGYEAYIAPDSRFKRDAGSLKEASYHLTLLAKNRIGFQNLIKLASAAFLEGFYLKPRIDKELLAAHSEGLICLSGCVSGEFSRTLLQSVRAGSNRSSKKPRQIAAWFHKVFGDRYFIEIQNNGARNSAAGVGSVGRSRPADGLAAGGHQRRPLCQPRRCRSPGRAALHQHGQVPHRHQSHADGGGPVLSSQPGRNVRGVSRAGRSGASKARRSPTASTSSWNSASGIFPAFTPPDEKTPSEYLRELCLAGLEGALCRRCRAAGPDGAACREEVHRPARSRTGRDRKARVSRTTF